MSNLKYILIICLPMLLIKCDRHPTVEITKSYIYNSNWNKNNHAAVSLWKVKVDSLINVSENITGFDIHNNMVKDSSYSFITSLNYSYKSKKVYFIKENNPLIWHKRFKTEESKNEINQLETNTWYRFDSYIYNSWIYYVYVDYKGTTHTYPVNPVNI